ncbi:MAG TPA: hypothetical protein VGZ22_28845 [Isosphaeraceae bacterium]|nr:hypothetical protein [Isosphaeraceae bacterium]
MSSQGDGFDAWLEQALRHEESVLLAPHPLPAQARYQSLAAAHRGRFYRVAGLASTKALIGVALTVITAAAAGGATEAAITGSANPISWVRQGIDQVEKCSAALGGSGLGECSETFTLQRENPRGAAPVKPGDESAKPSDRGGSGSPTSHGGGPPTDKGVPPTDKGGPPTNKPGGPPSGNPGGGAPSTPPGKSSPGSHKSTPDDGTASD